MVRVLSFSILIAFAASAALAEDLVPNTLNCAAFNKTPDGKWTAVQTITFDAGAVSGMTLSKGTGVGPHAINVNVDLYDLIEAKCGKK